MLHALLAFELAVEKLSIGDVLFGIFLQMSARTPIIGVSFETHEASAEHDSHDNAKKALIHTLESQSNVPKICASYAGVVNILTKWIAEGSGTPQFCAALGAREYH